jgi:hypothetical protein
LDHEEDDPPTLSTSSSRRRRCSLPPPTPLTSIAKATLAPLPPFHDASPVACTYELNLMDCLEGLVKARQLNFFNWDGFNVEEYEFFEQVEVRMWVVHPIAGYERRRDLGRQHYSTALLTFLLCLPVHSS